ncbi:hypothetical protein NLJ89_g1503 [Agrocybe chaxingu]|uniref:Uncharacterized protein n=1 Tax=Agrocybe chaxingu TaxID=84603 RepID=A0A9W8TD88_9AGAR|nr:hypothetical protein NLJ89_g1503 [Agrocybe chaxingu]
MYEVNVQVVQGSVKQRVLTSEKTTRPYQQSTSIVKEKIPWHFGLRAVSSLRQLHLLPNHSERFCFLMTKVYIKGAFDVLHYPEDFGALLNQAVATQCDAFEAGAEGEDVDKGSLEEPIGPQPLHPKSLHSRDSKRKAAAMEDANEPLADEGEASHSHRRRRQRRNEEKIKNGHVPRPEIRVSRVQALDDGFEDGRAACHLLELMEEGCKYIPWNGYTPTRFEDVGGNVFGIMASQPDDPSYREACNRVYDLFLNMGQMPELQDEVHGNRRGRFPVINVGVTHSQGTTSPVNLHYSRDGVPGKLAGYAEELLQSKDLARLATFASSSLKLWEPKLYDAYDLTLKKLWDHSPHLRKNFPKSVYPCMAVNCGPNVFTRCHRDSLNLPFGLCAIQALGNFDHTRGGHLVLPDLKLIIEFPSGSLILIPSATLVHANIPVQAGDARASFTQFCAGGLFRYVDNGFRTEASIKKKSKAEYRRICEEKKLRWKNGLSLLTNRSEIVVIDD